MTFVEIKNMIESIGLPCTYYQFPEDKAPDPPFICYFYTASNDFFADGINYQKIEELVIELYTDTKDIETELAVESVLTASGYTWTREETPLDSERLYEVIYTLQAVITEE